MFTGHEDPAKEETAIDYKALVAGKGTLVMLMGMDRLASIVPELLANGADPRLPVALIRWGTTGRQETLVGELGSIVAASAGFQPPAIAVFGRVVELRDKLRWFERTAAVWPADCRDPYPKTGKRFERKIENSGSRRVRVADHPGGTAGKPDGIR